MAYWKQSIGTLFLAILWGCQPSEPFVNSSARFPPPSSAALAPAPAKALPEVPPRRHFSQHGMRLAGWDIYVSGCDPLSRSYYDRLPPAQQAQLDQGRLYQLSVVLTNRNSAPAEMPQFFLIGRGATYEPSMELHSHPTFQRLNPGEGVALDLLFVIDVEPDGVAALAGDSAAGIDLRE